MLFLKDIIGQINSVRYLDNSIKSDRISDSYLFSGPAGVGRALTARAFLAEILMPGIAGKKALSEKEAAAMSQLEKGEYPDVKWIVPQPNKKISVEEAREVKDFLHLKPFDSPRNAVVIEDAHMMTDEASNALLKVLEEPPDNSIIILISDRKELIPATVLSRCSEVRFGKLPPQDVKSIIMAQREIDEKTADILVSFSQGAPGKVLETDVEKITGRYEALAAAVEGLEWSDIDALRTWDTEEKDILISDADALVMILRDVVLVKEGFEEMVLCGISPERIKKWKIYEKDVSIISRSMERIINARSGLSANVNPKMISQAMAYILTG